MDDLAQWRSQSYCGVVDDVDRVALREVEEEMKRKCPEN